MNSMAVGVDIAKQVSQVHYIDPESGEIVNKPIKRAMFLEHFANRASRLIGMEACGGVVHHWARQLISRACKIEFAGMDPTTQSGADVNAHLSQVCSARVEVEA